MAVVFPPRSLSASMGSSYKVPVVGKKQVWASSSSPTHGAPMIMQQQRVSVIQQQQPTTVLIQQQPPVADDGRYEHLLQIVNQERDRHLSVESQLRAEIELLKNRVSSLELGPQESELERRIREIEARGNVRIDWRRGLVEVVRDVGFVPRRTTESPDAELLNAPAASSIFDDVAEAASLVGGTVTVEGHTRGGESDFWAALAVDRARLVGEELIARGIDENRIVTRGLPGKRGLNKVAVLIHLDHGHQVEQL